MTLRGAYIIRMRHIKYLILFLILLIPSLSIAQGHSTQMAPLQSERLKNPIVLTDRCKNVNIIEWRFTPGIMRSTAPTKKNIKILDDICNHVMKNVVKFVKSKNYSLNDDISNFNTSVCIMPANLHRFGRSPRNLNDIKYRFSTRSKSYTPDGRLYSIWGYYQRYNNHIYIRNDVLLNDGVTANNDFKTTFAHELFHAISYYYGVYYQHNGNKSGVEEKLAEDFTEYLGLGR